MILVFWYTMIPGADIPGGEFVLITLDPVSIMVLVGMTTGFFAAAVLAGMPAGNRRANLLLALFMCSSAFSINHGIIYWTGLYRTFPFLIRSGQPFQLLVAPLFYFTIRARVSRFGFRWHDLLHGVLPLIFIVILIPFYLLPASEKIASTEQYMSGNAPLPFSILMFSIFFIYSVVYIILINRQVVLYNQRIKETFSNVERINLNWVRFFMFSFALVFLLFFVLFITGTVMGLDLPVERGVPVIVSIAIAWIGLRSLQQPLLHGVVLDTGKADGSSGIVTPVGRGARYERSGLADEQMAGITTRLEELMITEKPFTMPDLTLDKLAELAGCSRNDLSQVINRSFGINFYDFVNGYRVEEFKRLVALPENANFTLLGIALDAGFNSKATFNSIFKKMTGSTPGQYRRQITTE
jgi:AraC-like DNA-binding protein